jgi:hypothetical protein
MLPFLALSVHQRAANGGKRRHKAKVETSRMLRVMAHDPAASSTLPQRAANDIFSACEPQRCSSREHPVRHRMMTMFLERGGRGTRHDEQAESYS